MVQRILRLLGTALIVLGLGFLIIAALLLFLLNLPGWLVSVFVLWICGILGFMLVGWGVILVWNRAAAGCYAGSALAALSGALLVIFVFGLGHFLPWPPFAIIDGAAIVLGLLLGKYRRHQRLPPPPSR